MPTVRRPAELAGPQSKHRNCGTQDEAPCECAVKPHHGVVDQSHRTAHLSSEIIRFGIASGKGQATGFGMVAQMRFSIESVWKPQYQPHHANCRVDAFKTGWVAVKSSHARATRATRR